MNDGQQFSSSYMCHVCNKIYCQGSTLSKHLKTRHNFQWPSGHSRFRYKLESDGYYRLQTLRYESVELVEEINKNAVQKSTQIESTQTSQVVENDTLVTNGSNSVLDSTNSNNQNLQYTFNNLMDLSDFEQVQNVHEQANLVQANTSDYQSLINYENIKIDQIAHQGQVVLHDDDDQDTEEEIGEDNDQNYLIGMNGAQIPLVEDGTEIQFSQTSGDRIEFDLENFLNSNFRVKEQNFEIADNLEYNCGNQEKQEEILDYKQVELIDDQHQALLISNFN